MVAFKDMEIADSKTRTLHIEKGLGWEDVPDWKTFRQALGDMEWSPSKTWGLQTREERLCT